MMASKCVCDKVFLKCSVFLDSGLTSKIDCFCYFILLCNLLYAFIEIRYPGIPLSHDLLTYKLKLMYLAECYMSGILTLKVLKRLKQNVLK